MVNRLTMRSYLIAYKCLQIMSFRTRLVYGQLYKYHSFIPLRSEHYAFVTYTLHLIFHRHSMHEKVNYLFICYASMIIKFTFILVSINDIIRSQCEIFNSRVSSAFNNYYVFEWRHINRRIVKWVMGRAVANPIIQVS